MRLVAKQHVMVWRQKYQVLQIKVNFTVFSSALAAASCNRSLSHYLVLRQTAVTGLLFEVSGYWLLNVPETLFKRRWNDPLEGWDHSANLVPQSQLQLMRYCKPPSTATLLPAAERKPSPHWGNSNYTPAAKITAVRLSAGIGPASS